METNQEFDSNHPTITTLTKDSDQVFIFITFPDSAFQNYPT